MKDNYYQSNAILNDLLSILCRLVMKDCQKEKQNLKLYILMYRDDPRTPMCHGYKHLSVTTSIRVGQRKQNHC